MTNSDDELEQDKLEKEVEQKIEKPIIEELAKLLSEKYEHTHNHIHVHNYAQNDNNNAQELLQQEVNYNALTNVSLYEEISKITVIGFVISFMDVKSAPLFIQVIVFVLAIISILTIFHQFSLDKKTYVLYMRSKESVPDTSLRDKSARNQIISRISFMMFIGIMICLKLGFCSFVKSYFNCAH